MSCPTCLHNYAGPRGPECRRNPKQVVSATFIVQQSSDREPTASELADPANYVVLSMFPPADAHCGDYAQRI